jgi:hypothetical protein
VWAFGEVVMMMTPSTFRIEQEGTMDHRAKVNPRDAPHQVWATG